MTEEIIVYRNKMEKDFYDNNGPMILIAFIFLFVIIFFGVLEFLKFICKKSNWNCPDWILTTSIVAGIIFSGIITYKYVM